MPPAPRAPSWKRRIRAALSAGATTPFFLLDPAPVQTALDELEALDFGLPTRHWLSCKTQPVPALLRWWRSLDRPIEVVSEHEFLAALDAGFTPETLLVNGPAKLGWLPRSGLPGLHVNADSLHEAAALALRSRRNHWHLGLRLCTAEDRNPEHPDLPAPFGLAPQEVARAARILLRHGMRPDAVHFHLRTNIPSPEFHRRALASAADICNAARLQPAIVDIGGGLPPETTRRPDGTSYASDFRLQDFARILRDAWKAFPGTRELWMENGRRLLAGSGVLVVRILDIKDRTRLRQLICDGGRTLHALVATWEDHDLDPLESRRGSPVPTAVHGPTCMSFDCLVRKPLPRSLRRGDHLVWFDAGAYHLPWETRFSHGAAEVWWHVQGRTTCLRPRESYLDLKARWQPA